MTSTYIKTSSDNFIIFTSTIKSNLENSRESLFFINIFAKHIYLFFLIFSFIIYKIFFFPSV